MQSLKYCYEQQKIIYITYFFKCQITILRLFFYKNIIIISNELNLFSTKHILLGKKYNLGKQIEKNLIPCGQTSIMQHCRKNEPLVSFPRNCDEDAFSHVVKT